MNKSEYDDLVRVGHEQYPKLKPLFRQILDHWPDYQTDSQQATEMHNCLATILGVTAASMVVKEYGDDKQEAFMVAGLMVSEMQKTIIRSCGTAIDFEQMGIRRKRRGA